ncbi:MAG: DUF3131 domain-containing protein, partial [Nitrososphaerota archaeon]|nr:DUF3131 domain-containing protein [Nitrososphaerota archaeon]
MTEEYHDWEAQQDSLADKNRESLVSTAWKYFTSRMSESTGFVSSTDSFPFATLWDISSQILAMHSARELEIISRSWFDCHVQKILQSMVKMPLLVNDGALLPNRLYSVDSLDPADDTGAIGRYCGWSSTDIGVFLETKKVLSEACPYLRSSLEDVTSRWDIEHAVVEGVIQGFRKTTTGVVGEGGEKFDEDKYPYGTLSAKGFELEGLSVRAPRQPSHSTVVHGETVPWDEYGMTTLEPFVYEEIFARRGLGRWLIAGSLRSMLNVQLKHFLASGAFTCA